MTYGYIHTLYKLNYRWLARNSLGLESTPTITNTIKIKKSTVEPFSIDDLAYMRKSII